MNMLHEVGKTTVEVWTDAARMEDYQGPELDW